MINLISSIKYFDIIKNGPLETLSTVFFTDLFQNKVYETHAKLKKELRINSNFKYYGNIDGTGTSGNINTSRLKAISEALERYAFYSTCKEKNYGFNIEQNTSGMTAYPCFKFIAKRNADYEAIERWAISEWWQGNLKANNIETYDKIKYFNILTPFKAAIVTIVYIETKNNYAYGFACARTKKESLQKAIVELQRNYFVLSRSTTQFDICEDERRLIYFASSKGHEEFKEKHKRSLSLNGTISRPKIVFSGGITGEWTKFAHVWRTLYEHTNYDFLNKNTNHFIF